MAGDPKLGFKRQSQGGATFPGLSAHPKASFVPTLAHLGVPSRFVYIHQGMGQPLSPASPAPPASPEYLNFLYTLSRPTYPLYPLVMHSPPHFLSPTQPKENPKFTVNVCQRNCLLAPRLRDMPLKLRATAQTQPGPLPHSKPGLPWAGWNSYSDKGHLRPGKVQRILTSLNSSQLRQGIGMSLPFRRKRNNFTQGEESSVHSSPTLPPSLSTRLQCVSLRNSKLGSRGYVIHFCLVVRESYFLL